ncbi:MAG: UrcA family protein [Steroidobacteraceae bacterium]
MQILKSIHRPALWSVALTSLACLLGAAPASADTPGVRSVTVSYRDLNLSTIEGATALYRRLKVAANSVCDEPGAGIGAYQAWRSCYQAAMADAVTRVNSPLLTALYKGPNSSAAKTAMLSK